MDCTRTSHIGEWDTVADAVRAWRECGCLVCADALEELPSTLRTTHGQTTL